MGNRRQKGKRRRRGRISVCSSERDDITSEEASRVRVGRGQARDEPCKPGVSGEGGEQQQPAGTQGLGWLACDSDQVHQVDQDALGLTPLDQFPIARRF